MPSHWSYHSRKLENREGRCWSWFYSSSLIGSASEATQSNLAISPTLPSATEEDGQSARTHSLLSSCFTRVHVPYPKVTRSQAPGATSVLVGPGNAQCDLHVFRVQSGHPGKGSRFLVCHSLIVWSWTSYLICGSSVPYHASFAAMSPVTCSWVCWTTCYIFLFEVLPRINESESLEVGWESAWIASSLSEFSH